MKHLLAEVRLAGRVLRASPGYSAAAILTMAVALGATTAIFSVFDRLVLHPVSLPDPASLVAIWFNSPARQVQVQAISVPRYDELAARVSSFSSIALSGADTFTLTGNGDPLQLNGLRVSASFLPTLGVLPARGRNFLPSEDAPNGPAVCILSHEFWQTQFGGRDDLLGGTIQLDGRAWQVVGIMPPALTAPFGQVQIFTPRVADVSFLTAAQIQNGATYFQPIARLKPGVSLEQAAAELAGFSRGYAERYPARLDAKSVTYPRRFVESLVNGVAPSMYALLGAVACVLLIACANAASLFLNRLLGRRKDIAVRMSLGATRAAIVRQFLVESMVFSSIAAVLGALFAQWSLSALSSVVGSQLPPGAVLALNWRVLGFAAVVSLAAAVLTGLVPALQASRADLVEHLKDSARGSSSGHGGRLRTVLVVGEVMLSVTLLVSAALLLVSFVRLQASALGFETRGVATAAIGLSPSRYPTPAQQADFYERVIEHLERDATIQAAAAGLGAPLLGATRMPYAVGGRPIPPLGDRPITNANIVTSDFFKVFAVPVIAGRSFTADDRATAPLVCLVNDTLAKHLFDGRAAVGESLLIGRDANITLRIIGVIRDVKSAGANAPTPDEIYMPLRQRPNPALVVMARTSGDPARLQAAFRDAVAAVDHNQAVSFFATMDSTVAQNVGSQRLVAMLTSIFAGLALVLALIGVYSVLAYGVSQRTPEIGIRMALGATRHEVVSLVMRGGLTLVGGGVAAGLIAAAAASRLLRQLLFGVGPLSAAVYGGVAVAFILVAALACLGPSLRASRIDPLSAVRGD